MDAAGAEPADVILVGAGLANSLIALRLRAERPGLRVRMLERAPLRDTTHTWSFFATDLTALQSAWVAPLVAARWPSYEVRFPAYARSLACGYGSIRSEGLAGAVETALGPGLIRGADAVEVTPTSAVLADGRCFTAPLVIDGRGARPSQALPLAWQKFVGLELRLDQPHGLTQPMVMDAAIPQTDGYRFVYVLPLSADVVLVEDTYYSDGSDLETGEVSLAVERYAAAHGWAVVEELRRESGVLPIALGGDIDGFWREQDPDTPAAGLRAALFHPTTGYSLPDAVRLAELIAGAPTLTSTAIAPMVRARSRRLWRERGVFRMLNRMMFLAAEPKERYRVLQRFYSLPQPLIERFYAARLTWADKARLVVGRPPVPILRALAALPEGAAAVRLAAHA